MQARQKWGLSALNDMVPEDIFVSKMSKLLKTCES